jgi:RecJ-like exonuclease
LARDKQFPRVEVTNYPGNSDLFRQENPHRCDLKGIEQRIGWHVTRCPVCRGWGKVSYTFGDCTECSGTGVVMACYKHRTYWKGGVKGA